LLGQGLQALARRGQQAAQLGGIGFGAGQALQVLQQFAVAWQLARAVPGLQIGQVLLQAQRLLAIEISIGIGPPVAHLGQGVVAQLHGAAGAQPQNRHEQRCQRDNPAQ